MYNLIKFLLNDSLIKVKASDGSKGRFCKQAQKYIPAQSAQ